MGSNPTGGGRHFLTKFILFCVTLDLSDNLTEMLILKNATLRFFRVTLDKENVVHHPSIDRPT